MWYWRPSCSGRLAPEVQVVTSRSSRGRGTRSRPHRGWRSASRGHATRTPGPVQEASAAGPSARGRGAPGGVEQGQQVVHLVAGDRDDAGAARVDVAAEGVGGEVAHRV